LKTDKMALKFVMKPCKIEIASLTTSNSLKPMRTIFPVLGTSAVLLLCSLSLAAQQIPIAAPSYSDKTATPKNNPKSGGPENSGSSAGAAVDNNTYKVGPSDVLMINVWNEDKFTGQRVVQQNGNITLPLVGDILAGGTTPKDIEAAVAQSLTKYVVKPLVTVTVLDVQSKKYYLDGLANKPGEYALAVPTTVLQAISRAGGLQEFANEKKIYVLRAGKQIPFNYKDVMKGKHMEQNIQLEPDDHIFIP
jgi:polysaccharide biosynthesis/export protein